MSEKDDFWQRVDEFYAKYPEQRQAEQTWEYWSGIEDVLKKLIEDEAHQPRLAKPSEAEESKDG